MEKHSGRSGLLCSIICLIGLPALAFCLCLLAQMFVPSQAMAAPAEGGGSHVDVSMHYQQTKPDDDITDGKTWVAYGARTITMTIRQVPADQGELTVTDARITSSSTDSACPVLKKEADAYTLTYQDPAGEQSGQEYDLSKCQLAVNYSLKPTDGNGNASVSKMTFKKSLDEIGMTTLDARGESVPFASTVHSLIVDSTPDRSVRLWVEGQPEGDPLRGNFRKADSVSLSSKDPWIDRVVNIAYANHKRDHPDAPFSLMTLDQEPRQNQAGDPRHEEPFKLACPTGTYSADSRLTTKGPKDHQGSWNVLTPSCRLVNIKDLSSYNSNARYTAKVQDELAKYLRPEDPAQNAEYLSFVYDTQIPMLTSVSYIQPGHDSNSDDRDYAFPGDGVMAFKDRTVRLRVKDKLPLRPAVDKEGNPQDRQLDRTDQASDSNASGADTLILTGSRYSDTSKQHGAQLVECPSGGTTPTSKGCDYTVSTGTDPTSPSSRFFDVNFSSTGYYDLTSITAKVVDKAGNEDQAFALKGASEDGKAPDTSHVIGKLLMDLSYQDSGDQLRIAVTSHHDHASQAPDAVPPAPSGSDLYYYNSDVDLTLQVKSALLKDYLLLIANQPGQSQQKIKLLKYNLAPPAGTNDTETTCTIDPTSLKSSSAQWRWSLPCGGGIDHLSDGSIPANGAYTFKLNDSFLPSFLGATVKFGIDTNPPVVSEFEGPTGGHDLKLVKFNGQTIVTSPSGNSVRVRVQDLLPKEQRGNERIDTAAQQGTSGISDGGDKNNRFGSVVVEMPAPKDLNRKLISNGTANKLQTLPINNDGRFTIRFDDEGLYDLSEVKLTVRDRADYPKASNDGAGSTTGNGLTTNLADLVKQHEQTNSFGEPYDALVIDNPRGKREARISLSQAEGNPPSTKPGYYFRGDAIVDFSVTDRWFPLYQKLDETTHKHFLNPTVAPSSPTDFPAVPFGQKAWERVKSESDTWVYRGYQVPRSVVNSDLPHEGTYKLDVSYAGLQSDSQYFASAHSEFVIDYTGPKLGGLHLSTTAPQHWQWVFPTSPLHVSLDGVNDAVSGIDAQTLAFADFRGPDPTPMLGYDPWLAPQGADTPESTLRFESDDVVGFDMNADSQRLRFDGTSIAVKDKAGNPSSTHALDAYGDKQSGIVNDARGLTGAALDFASPKLSLKYDNNDVRNGKYYKAKRVATVTIDESNFDFVAGHDGKRVIVTSAVDGRKSQLRAEDFSNPSGDKHTYVANLSCETDGDWVMDAAFTDPGDHQGNPVHDEFVIDTTRPVLSLAFDNNDSKNGMYYKAPRVATVKLVERNMSDKESAVTTTAKNDANQDVPAPSGDGWSQIGDAGKYTFVQHVPFSGEHHYTLEARATDLAGNVADAAKEPEFVVDMTKPDLHIDKVEDKTAYAGTVAPRIMALDANMDQGKTTYELAGDRRGRIKSIDLDAQEGGDDNSLTVDIPDFKRKAENDDVYTLTAKSEDMAGNSATVTKTFSVNRFGSTYLFSAGTASIRGAYLKKAVPVTVTELNVSGIDQRNSKIDLAKDGRIGTVPESGYQVIKSTDKGWSKQTYEIPANVFKGDGYYRLMFTSTDKAGNLSENSMQHKDAKRKGDASVNFALDSQAPTVSALGIDSNRVYYGQRRDVGIDAKDNMKIRLAKVYVDGVKRGEWPENDLLKGMQYIDLPADAHNHTVTVRTEDAAGNVSTATYHGVIVASNLWQYIRENGLLFVLVVCTGILFVLMILVAAVLIVRRRSELAYRRNPFGKSGR